MATTHFLRILRSVFSFELSSVPLSDIEVDTIGAASAEAVEDVIDEAIESLLFADGPEDEEAMIRWKMDPIGILKGEESRRSPCLRGMATDHQVTSSSLNGIDKTR